MIVQICVGSSCYLKGSEKIVELFQKAIQENKLDDEITLTGRFCSNKCNRVGVTITIDDDIIYLRSIHDWLSDKYSVTMLNSAASGVIYLAKNSADLILLDYAMPIANGENFFTMIRSEPTTSKIPVIFLTGKSDRETVSRILSLNPDGYLLKTLTPEAIHKAVDQFFETKRIKESLYASQKNKK